MFMLLESGLGIGNPLEGIVGLENLEPGRNQGESSQHRGAADANQTPREGEPGVADTGREEAAVL